MFRFVAQFAMDRTGNVAITAALVIAPLLGMVGIAVDLATWNGKISKLQSVADTAALAGAKMLGEGETNISSISGDVQKYITANSMGIEGVVVDALQIDTQEGTVHVALSQPGERSLSAILAHSDTVLHGAATAVAGANTAPLCVLALDPSMSKAVEASGGSGFTANECSVHVDSNSPTAVNLSGGGEITSAQNCFVGGVKSGLYNISPSPEPSCDPRGDPFAHLPKPSVGPCDHVGYSENTAQTLNPGVYCDGLRLSNETFTLNPGLYIIKDGEFTSSGGATILGDGVTFFLTGSDVGVTWSGGGNYQFKAMSTGPLKGFVVFLDPDATPKQKSHISGGGDTTYEGVLYFPNQKLEISGGGTVTTPSPFTAFVANNFVFSGGSHLTIGIDPGSTTVPVPSGLYKNIGTARLVE